LPKITISAQAEHALRAVGNNIARIAPNKDGTYTVDVSADTLARVQEVAFDGEGLSDVLVRIAAFAAANGRKN